MSIEANNIKLLHSACFFNKCSRNNHGGAIYFQCRSSIIQHRFCTTEASISNGYNGFHSWTHLINNEYDRQNHIIECSISKCTQQNSYSLVYMQNGNCGIFSSNISDNSVYHYSGFQIYLTKGLSKINFTTFEDNNAQGNICLVHNTSPDGSFEDYKCNIVNNKQQDTGYGIIYTDAQLYVKNCTILGPYGNGKPFYRNANGYLYLINCNVDSLEIYSYNNQGTFSTNNVKFTDDLNVLAHLSTYNCVAEIKLNTNVKLIVKNAFTCLCEPGCNFISRLYYYSIIIFCSI